MRVVIAVMLVFVAGAWAACDSDPDGTNEKLFYQSCNPGEALVVNQIVLTHDDGSANYPVDVTHPLDLMLNITNTAKTSFDQIVISATIARYTDIFGLCSWIGIPTFGLLDHLDGCTFGTQNVCPLPPGVSILHDRIDFTPFQTIIDLLSTSEPYRLTLSFKSGGTEISCAVAEAKIRK